MRASAPWVPEILHLPRTYGEGTRLRGVMLNDMEGISIERVWAKYRNYKRSFWAAAALASGQVSTRLTGVARHPSCSAHQVNPCPVASSTSFWGGGDRHAVELDGHYWRLHPGHEPGCRSDGGPVGRSARLGKSPALPTAPARDVRTRQPITGEPDRRLRLSPEVALLLRETNSVGI